MRRATIRSHDGAEVVVVGGGTAGCVVAGRLAEAGHDVLVLEAGPDYGSFDERRWPDDLLDARSLPTSHDWGYEGPGFGGRTLSFQRARVLGGCSAHNGCAQMVGWGPDYDRWAKETPGWSAAELRPLFTVAGARMRIRDWRPEEIQPFQQAFLEAAGQMGLPMRNDLDDLDAGVSVGCAPVNIADGVRWNASFAYLDPVRGTGRLTVAADSIVDRILVRAGRATRVELRREGAAASVSAETVVLCAGAYGTPEVLLRSGIGPARQLTSLGVDVVVDLPGVGANLHDHPIVQLEFAATKTLADDVAAFARERWLPEEQAAAKIVSTLSDGPYDLHVFPWIEPDAALAAGWRVVLPIGLVTPRSRGGVTLRSSDPFAVANVDHGFLREQDDVTSLVEGFRWVAELVQSSPPLGRYLGRQLSSPGRDDQEGIRSWIRNHHQHYWHPAGSCRMGRHGDPRAVVGPDGSVHGLPNLFVGDASVFPQIPRATPAWPTVVVGERIARSMMGHHEAVPS
jgi:choline dehydrogenase-like flavoprotein